MQFFYLQNDGLYYVQKSLVLLMQGKIGAAGNSVDKGLMLNPDLALSWTDKGLIAQAKGDKVEAEYDYQKALSLDPTDPTALKKL
jgi:Tfp pilus assembly protein PilF